MRIHKQIIVDLEKMKEVLRDVDLVERALALIEDYNSYKGTEIEFTYSWNTSKCREWGYDYGGDVELLDDFFMNVLEMKERTKKSWDNKTAQKYYFYED